MGYIGDLKTDLKHMQGVCPHCGYCPHCGRSGLGVVPYWMYWQNVAQTPIWANTVCSPGGYQVFW
jgi:hypothetical protein